MFNQRSVDTFLGLPFNIASYGLLLEIIAKEVNINGSKDLKKDENQKTSSEEIKNNNDILNVEKENSNNEDDEVAPTIN